MYAQRVENKGNNNMEDYYFCQGCNQMIEAGGDNLCRCNDQYYHDEDAAYERHHEEELMRDME